MELTEEQRNILSQLDLATTEAELQGPGENLAQGNFFDDCFAPRMALAGSIASLLASIAGGLGSIPALFAPDPTTLTKWAAAGAAIAIVASFEATLVSYQALIDCERQKEDTEARAREIAKLGEQQQKLQQTVDSLKREIDRLANER